MTYPRNFTPDPGVPAVFAPDAEHKRFCEQARSVGPDWVDEKVACNQLAKFIGRFPECEWPNADIGAMIAGPAAPHSSVVDEKPVNRPGYLLVRGVAGDPRCLYRQNENPPEGIGDREGIEKKGEFGAALEKERHDREERERDEATEADEKRFLEPQKQLHRELADEYVVPMIAELEKRLVELERLHPEITSAAPLA